MRSKTIRIGRGHVSLHKAIPSWDKPALEVLNQFGTASAMIWPNTRALRELAQACNQFADEIDTEKAGLLDTALPKEPTP